MEIKIVRVPNLLYDPTLGEHFHNLNQININKTVTAET